MNTTHFGPVRERVRLERGAIADVMRNPLSQIPSLFGRLVYLSSVRDPTSGRYLHHGLALVYGEEEADAALRKCHMQAFEEWISLGLECQKADLELYLAPLCRSQRSTLANWQKLHSYEQLLPAGVRRPTEGCLFLADFDTLIKLMSSDGSS